MIEITEELLQRIYSQADEVFKINVDQYGFDYLEIQEDGTLRAVVSGSYRSEDDHYDLNTEDLNQNLDHFIEQRKVKLEEERVKNAERARLVKIAYEQFSKEQRKKQYLELKKEFEG